MPVDALEVIALGQKNGPQNVKDALVFPAAEGAIDAEVVAKLGRQMVPLAACSHSEDETVERTQHWPCNLATSG